MIKWGLLKKDLADMDLPDEIKKQMKSIYSKFANTDPVVILMDQLCRMTQAQAKTIEEYEQKAAKFEMRLKQAYNEKNFQADLLTSMCEEIQAPIHTMNQIGEWINQTHLDPNQKAGFDMYRITGRKLSDLFKNIIDVSKLREGVFQLDPISFELKEVVRDILLTLNLTAQEKGLSLHINMDSDIPKYLIGDMQRLEQVLISLINNAIKFTYQGEVRVLIQKGKDDGAQCAINFLVMDTGTGIPEDQLENIFDRLAQGDPDVQRNFGGTGLGLFICKSLVEQMGGTIWAENRKEGGATFGFGIEFEKGAFGESEKGFPLQYEAEQETEVDDELPKKVGASGSNGNNLNVLVVEDCQETCRLIESFLEEGPYNVDIVNDGLTALKKYGKGGYDLILMDIQLPGLDGVGATLEIRGKETNGAAKTPIFALVGSASEAEGHYMAADFDECLIKPVSKKKLLGAISKLNSPKKAAAK